jgi:hypothetical protein
MRTPTGAAARLPAGQGAPPAPHCVPGATVQASAAAAQPSLRPGHAAPQHATTTHAHHHTHHTTHTHHTPHNTPQATSPTASTSPRWRSWRAWHSPRLSLAACPPGQTTSLSPRPCSATRPWPPWVGGCSPGAGQAGPGWAVGLGWASWGRGRGCRASWARAPAGLRVQRAALGHAHAHTPTHPHPPPHPPPTPTTHTTHTHTPPHRNAGYSEEQAVEALAGAVDVYVSKFRPMRHTMSGRDERTLMKLLVHSESDRVVGCHM